MRAIVLLSILLFPASAWAQLCITGVGNNAGDTINGTVNWHFGRRSITTTLNGSGGEAIRYNIVSTGVENFSYTAAQDNETVSENLVSGNPSGWSCSISITSVTANPDQAIKHYQKDQAALTRDRLWYWRDWTPVLGTFCATASGPISGTMCAFTFVAAYKWLDDIGNEKDAVAHDPCATPSDQTQWPPDVDQNQYGECDPNDWICPSGNAWTASIHYYTEMVLANSYACREGDAQWALDQAKDYEQDLSWLFAVLRDGYDSDQWGVLNGIAQHLYEDANQ